MKIQLEEHIAHDADAVWRVLWERFSDLPEHLPHVQAITPLHHERPGEGHEYTHHQWNAEPDVIPRLVRPFVKPSVFRWIGKANWYHERRLVQFHFESEVFKNLYEAKGEFLVVPSEDGQGAFIHVRADLDIYAERLPGVPRWLAARVVPTIEGLLMDRIGPSLAALPGAVRKYL